MSSDKRDPSPASFRGILAQPNFARLWYGQIISSLGDRFYLWALLVILGIHQGLNAGKDSARMTFCAMLPGLLLAPLYGFVIDRFSRRWVMIYADLMRVGLTLSLLYFWFVLHSFGAVFTIIFLMGACNGLFIPARQAALPQIVDPAQLVTANALISLVGVIANFVGSPVASLVVSIFGAPANFVLNAMGFIVSAWCVFHIRSDLRPTKGPVTPATEVSTWGGALAGWRVLREQRELGALVLVNSAFSFVGAIVLITLLQQVVVSVDLTGFGRVVDAGAHFVARFTPKPPVIEDKPLAFSLLMAAIGLGLGIRVGLCGRARVLSRAKALPYLGLALVGVALIVFAQLRAYTPALLGAAFLGILSSFILIPIEARLQNDVDDARRGRLFALRNLCTTTSFLAGLGVNLDGSLLQKVGPANLIAYTGMAALGLAIVLAAVNAGTLRSFWSTRQPNPPSP
jgi:MFS family permease